MSEFTMIDVLRVIKDLAKLDPDGVVRVIDVERKFRTHGNKRKQDQFNLKLVALEAANTITIYGERRLIALTFEHNP